MVIDLLSKYIAEDNIRAVEIYLDNGRCPDSPLSNNLTPLQYAQIHDSEEVYYLLLESGATASEYIQEQGFTYC